MPFIYYCESVLFLLRHRGSPAVAHIQLLTTDLCSFLSSALTEAPPSFPALDADWCGRIPTGWKHFSPGLFPPPFLHVSLKLQRPYAFSWEYRLIVWQLYSPIPLSSAGTLTARRCFTSIFQRRPSRSLSCNAFDWYGSREEREERPSLISSRGTAAPPLLSHLGRRLEIVYIGPDCARLQSSSDFPVNVPALRR